ncbi:hypothetical protein FE257_004275 [Aspergillus nanangensis]|uniref:Alpha/beta hydrolase fold-3 domain-containing protein n=1 Tax=Aspergillus nanangensis TaxID=2582783 RepID=A0AAD4GV79_ASPNN|nr:hypothetical protein FE257_004275 [Aspergillus nanangensis]
MPLSKDILEFIAQFGNTWNLNVNSECEKYFESCHAAADSPSDTLKVDKAVSYGPDPRHRLDVVYFHGGGFRAGDNDISPHIHGNIGKYFAKHGMICILATYRLLPEARYPSGIEDITSALKWTKDNIASYNGDPTNVFPIGQSAGGAHVAMALFTGSLEENNVVPRGIMLQSAPLWYDLSQERRRANMVEYYSTTDEQEILAKAALGAFNATHIAQWPEIFLSVGEFDAQEIVLGNLMFLESFLRKRKRVARFEVLKGQNHISYALAIDVEGDEVGPRILDWVWDCSIR